MSRVLLLAGAPASGKSTIGALLCRAGTGAVLIEVDAVRHGLDGPAAEPWEGDEGAARYRRAIAESCWRAGELVAAGRAVVIADVAPPETLGRYRSGLGDRTLHAVLLRAEPDELVARDRLRCADRGGSDPAGWPRRIVALARLLDLRAGRYDQTLDTTGREAGECARELARALRPLAPRATTAPAARPRADGGQGRAMPG